MFCFVLFFCLVHSAADTFNPVNMSGLRRPFLFMCDTFHSGAVQKLCASKGRRQDVQSSSQSSLCGVKRAARALPTCREEFTCIHLHLLNKETSPDVIIDQICRCRRICFFLVFARGSQLVGLLVLTPPKEPPSLNDPVCGIFLLPCDDRKAAPWFEWT